MQSIGNSKEETKLKVDDNSGFDFSNAIFEPETAALEDKINKKLDRIALREISKAVKLPFPLEHEVNNIIYRITSLIIHFLNEQDTNNLADAIKMDVELQRCLLVIVKSSGMFLENISNIELIASRAITILNAARISFSRMDLARIRIPGANLRYSIMSGTDLQRADLQGVVLADSFLKGVNFSKSNMKDINFLQKPFLPGHGKIQCMAWFSTRQWLFCATKMNDQINGVQVIDLSKEHPGDIISYASKTCRSKDEIVGLALDSSGTILITIHHSFNIKNSFCVWKISYSQNALAINKFSEKTIDEELKSISIHPNQSIVVIGSFKRCILYNHITDTTSSLFFDSETFANSIAFSNDGSILAFVTDYSDPKLYLYDGNTYAFQNQVNFEIDSDLTRVIFSPDDRWIAVSTTKGYVTIIETCNLDNKHDVRVNDTEEYYNICFDPLGKIVFFNNYNSNTIYSYDVYGKYFIPLLHAPIVNSIISELLCIKETDNYEIVTGHDTGHICRLRAIDNNQDYSINNIIVDDSKIIRNISFQSKIIEVIKNKLSKIYYLRQRDLSNGRKLNQIKLDYEPHCIGVHPNKSMIAIGFQGNNGKILFYDLCLEKFLNLEILLNIKNEYSYVEAVQFSKNGYLFACAYNNTNYKIYSIEDNNGLGLQTIYNENCKQRIWSIAFTPDSQGLIIGLQQGIKYLHINSRKSYLEEMKSAVLDIKFNDNGKLLVTNSLHNSASSGNFSLFSISEDKGIQSIYTFKDHVKEMRCVAFSPQRDFIVSGGEDQELIFWRLPTQEEIQNFNNSQKLHDNLILYKLKDYFFFTIEYIYFDAEGGLIVTDQNGVTSRWNVAFNKDDNKFLCDMLWCSTNPNLYIKEINYNHVIGLSQDNNVLISQLTTHNSSILQVHENFKELSPTQQVSKLSSLFKNYEIDNNSICQSEDSIIVEHSGTDEELELSKDSINELNIIENDKNLYLFNTNTEFTQDDDNVLDFSNGVFDPELSILEDKINQNLDSISLRKISKAVKLPFPLEHEVNHIIYRISSIIIHFLNEQDTNNLADAIKMDVELQRCLLVIVKSSGMFLKNISNIGVIASRAITILNAASISFSGMDLSDTQIPDANLNYGIFDDTNFTRTNLKNVKLRGAWLNNANFNEASMGNAFFGEYPYLQLPYPVKFFCISPNRRYLAVAFAVIVQKPIIIYSLETLNVVQSVDGEMLIDALVYSPTNQQLAYSNDNLIQLWSPETGVLIKTLDGHTDYIDALAYCYNGEQLVSGSRDKTIKLWDIKTGNSLSEFKGGSGSIKNLIYNHNTRQLVSGGLDNILRLWNIETNQLELISEEHAEDIDVIVFRPDDKQLASGHHNGTIRLWNLSSRGNICAGHFLNLHTEEILALSYSPNNILLASASRDNTVRLWDVMTGNIQYTLLHHDYIAGINCISFSYDGLQLVSGSDDNSIRLWNTKTGELQETLNGHSHGISFLSYELDGSILISGSAVDKTVRWWNIADVGKYSSSVKNFFKHPMHVNAIAFRPDGKQIASGDDNDLIILWDVKNETICSQKILKIHSSSINTLAYRFDSKQLASGSSDNNIILWDAEGNLYKTLSGHEHYIFTVIYRKDGKQLASASGDSTIRLWNPESGDCLYSLKEHSNIVTALSYCSDGRQLASGGHDNKVLVWDSENGTLLRSFDFSYNGTHVNLVRFKENCQLAAFSTNGYFVNIAMCWNLMDGKLIERKTGGEDEIKQLRQWVDNDDVDTDEIDSSGKIMVTAWSLDRAYLATGSFDETVRLFRIITKNPIKAQLLWSSHQSTSLNASLAIFTSAILSKQNESLLRLHGAIFEKNDKSDNNYSDSKDPFMPMYNAIKSMSVRDFSKMSQEKLDSEEIEINNNEFQEKCCYNIND